MIKEELVRQYESLRKEVFARASEIIGEVEHISNPDVYSVEINNDQVEIFYDDNYDADPIGAITMSVEEFLAEPVAKAYLERVKEQYEAQQRICGEIKDAEEYKQYLKLRDKFGVSEWQYSIES